MKKVITTEQLFTAILLKWGRAIDRLTLLDLITEFKKVTNNEYIVVNDSLIELKECATYDGWALSFNDNINLKTPIDEENPDYTYEQRLINLAGPIALGYIDFIINKGCLNCINGSCRVPYKEKLGVDRKGFPEGNRCIGWENETYKRRILKRNNLY